MESTLIKHLHCHAVELNGSVSFHVSKFLKNSYLVSWKDLFNVGHRETDCYFS